MTRKLRTDRFVASCCRDNYYTFFTHFWPQIAAEKLIANWHLKALCDELQVISERVFFDKAKLYDLLINCPPGMSKSSIVSVLWQPWIWTRMPSARFISGCYSERLALDHSRKSRDVVLSEKYQALFPEIKLREDQSTKGYFVNSKGGMRFATGVGGTVTGMHGHFLAIDDPLDPIGALSDLIIQEANVWITETLSDRKVEKQLTPTVMVMQRLHQNDPSGNWLEREPDPARLRHICLPADDSAEIKPPEWTVHYQNHLLEPHRLSQTVIEEAAKRGEAYLAGQYFQSPVPRGGSLFKVDRLQYNRIPPVKWKRGPVRFWDKAATAKKSACFTAGVKMGLDHEDRFWILDVVRGQWDSGQREKIILEVAQQDGREVRIGIEQEPGGSGKESAEQAAKNYSLKGYRVTIDPVRGDKASRADSFSIQVNIGNVTLVPGMWNRAFVEEMRFFPVGRYLDQIDSCSGGFSMLTKPQMRIGALR